MKEEFITYEQAVALKECGFDWECSHYYVVGDKSVSRNYTPLNFNSHPHEFSAPALAAVQKWLREVHNIHIQIICTTNKYWMWQTELVLMPIDPERTYKPKIIYVSHDYKDAFMAGLDAALKLIKE